MSTYSAVDTIVDNGQIAVVAHWTSGYNGRTVSANGDISGTNSAVCGRCEHPHDPQDNFCRGCGASLRGQRLPSVRESRALDVWRPRVPGPVVKGVAFVAAGTVAEALGRRALRRIFKRGDDRLPAKSANGDVAHDGKDGLEEGQLVSETLLLRRVLFRR